MGAYLNPGVGRFEMAVNSETSVWGMAARQFENVVGCKFQYVLTLVGPQGIGKSTAIATLCGPDYFTDNLSFNMMRDKQSAENIQGNWIVELGEMAGVSKAEGESVKAFIARQAEKSRPS